MGTISQTRLELEARWWKRVLEARQRYAYATETLRFITFEYAEGLPSPDGHFAIQQAQQNEVSALNEYRRLLKIYVDLLTQGKHPPPDA